MAATADVPPEWKRLGGLLTDRRVHLGYRERTQFCAERGVDYRLVYDIEQARRVNFTRSTIAALEVAYLLRPGAIPAALAGGDLEPARPPQPDPERPRLAAVPDSLPLPDDPSDEQVEAFIIAQEPFSRRDLLWRAWRFTAAARSERVKAIRALTDPVDLEEDQAERHREPGA